MKCNLSCSNTNSSEHDSFMAKSRLSVFGSVARDDKGRWIDGFYGQLSMKATSNLTPKLWAIHSSLTLTKNYNLKKVVIGTDSNGDNCEG